MFEHLREARNGTHKNAKLQRMLLELLAENVPVVHEKVFEHTEEWPCLALEVDAIYFYGLDNLCNLSSGGENCVMLDETKAKISQTLKGRLFSEATRARISAGVRALPPRSPEHRAKISRSKVGHSPYNKGKPMSEAQKLLLSLKAKSYIGKKNGFFGRTHSETSRAKMSARHKRRVPISEDTRAKLSMARKGKSHSAEWVARQVASAQRTRQAKKLTKLT